MQYFFCCIIIVKVNTRGNMPYNYLVLFKLNKCEWKVNYILYYKYIKIYKAPCLFTPFFAMQRKKKKKTVEVN